MQSAVQFDQSEETAAELAVAATAPAFEKIVLIRPSGSRVSFEGHRLAEAHSRTSYLDLWHEIALYRKAEGSFVVSIAMVQEGTEGPVAMHIFNAQDLEDVMGIVERYSDSVLEMEPAKTGIDPVVASHRSKQIHRHYEALVGELLYAISAQK